MTGWPPSQFPVVALGRLVARRDEPPRVGDGTVTAFRDGEVVLRTERRVEGFTEAIEESGYQRVYQGDLVIHAMDAFAGAIGVSKSTGKCSPVCQVLVPTDAVDARFAAYVLREAARSGYIASLARGIRVRSTDFRWAQAKAVPIPAPPPPAQRVIADFLDRECARIDELVAEVMRFRDVAAAWLQSQTDRAVHKESDRTGPLRWLGCSCVTGPFGTALSATEYVEGGVPVVNPTHIVNGAIVPSGHETVPEEVAVRLARYRLKVGDLVVGRKGDVGRAALVGPDETGFVCGSDSIALRSNNEVLHPEFLAQLFRTTEVRDGLLLRSSGATLANMNEGNLLSVRVPVISLEIQAARSARVDKERARYVQVDSEVARLQTTLTEYRDALITEAVTGRLDVSAMGDQRMSESLAAVAEGEEPEVLS